MKKSLVIPLLLGCITTLSHAEVTVTPVGLQSVWDDGGDTFGGFKTFNSKPGVKIALHVQTDKDTLIGIDEKESKVNVGGVEALYSFYASSSSISKDGKTLRLDIKAEGAKPVNGKIVTSGEVVVSTANGKKLISSEVLEWKKGAKVQFPKEANLPTFEIDKIGKPDWGDEKWEVTLKTNKEFDKFVSVKFIDEQGKEHNAKRGGSSSMTFLGKTSVTVSYKAPENISKAKMVVEVWKGLNKTKVPVNFTLGNSGPE